MSSKNGHRYEFGDFRLYSEPPSLWRDESLVPLPPKALEMLLLLVRQREIIVSREELLETVWRDTFVEDGNINYTVSLLRKILDKDDKGRFIQTVPKRGYRFVADVLEISANGHAEKAVRNVEVAIPTEEPKPKIRWHFIGIVLLGVLFVTGFVIWRKSDESKKLSTTAVTSRNIRTVAVLPLKTLAEDDGSKSLSLGLTDSLISRLGSLNRFSVRPLSSVRSYAEVDQDPLKFGETLKVDVILEGTLQQADNRLRANVRLWDLRDGAQLWQRSFDSTEADFFNLQDAVATGVTRWLLSELQEKDRELLTRRYTNNPEAFRAYVRGRAILDAKNPDNFEKAIDEFQKAVALDPTFALAYAGLADASTRLGFNTSGASQEEIYARSKALAQKALDLDAETPEAYAALGTVKRIYDWDWLGAEREFRRAIELNPNYARAHLGYALLLSCLGRSDEALVEIKRAMEIDPLSQDVKSGYLTILEGRGEYAEALAQAQENVKFNKEYRRGMRGVATFLFHLGEYPRVIEISEQELTAKNSQEFVWLSLLVTSHHRSGQTGKRDERLKQLEEVARTDTKALYALAENYAELGRTNDALAALEKCIEVREERMMWLKVEPRLAQLKGNARFDGILRGMNLASN
ncbi:MAG TPA: winged helix-turn-helix domain-containing protein [Pyrinomonadaceae bacterium]|nr:winged helix-turn-helix domain-containing protein [Pyrinomonadaceae bacterium]